MKKHLSPGQVLVIGFLSFILIGALLLMLPISNTKGCSFVDALYTATSAVCVTGLIVKDIPNDFTLFGQMVILLLIQLGGLGYMTSATLIFLMIGKKIGIGDRLVMKEALNLISVEGIVKFTKGIIVFTLFFETIGALILTIKFLNYFEFKKALLYGIFHSISAFNNAGFSLFSDNLIRFRGDAAVNITITTLVITGGIGFIVISDLYNRVRGKAAQLMQHTKIVISVTAMLIIAGALLIYFFESSDPQAFKDMTLKESAFVSYFAAVAPRTAGFNTVDYSLLKAETLYLTIMLMFIGASPGSTGGGVKTSTFAIVIASLWSSIRGLRDVVMFRRRIPYEMISKSLLLVVLAGLFCAMCTLFVIKTQNVKSLDAMFEVVSAFGTVGLSVGDGGARSLSALFSDAGKLLVSFIMLAGRVGPITLAIAFVGQKEENFRYPEGKVMIG